MNFLQFHELPHFLSSCYIMIFWWFFSFKFFYLIFNILCTTRFIQILLNILWTPPKLTLENVIYISFKTHSSLSLLSSSSLSPSPSSPSPSPPYIFPSSSSYLSFSLSNVHLILRELLPLIQLFLFLASSICQSIAFTSDLEFSFDLGFNLWLLASSISWNLTYGCARLYTVSKFIITSFIAQCWQVQDCSILL